MDKDKALDQIKRLIPRTVSNGASEFEEDAAARLIGRIVMRYPDLIQTVFDPPEMSFSDYNKRDGQHVRVNHRGVVRETLSAVLLSVGNRDLWFPKRHVLSLDEETATVSKWIAEQLGLTR
jgi:hypothetical protein